ncbi:aldo/keto reductase [Roseisolibacter agri]|uniref:Oxidoreductase n=1 Tax=Roseisolibacter agri TaxID=2014610 RepID=A0AA37V1L3_9BACT|nr:aldo/keto reductase [Roseisolibacter agri]GLC26425.1 oxidoreductase [Roseisolibacter agri]
MRRSPNDSPDRAPDALGRRDLLKLLVGAGAALSLDPARLAASTIAPSLDWLVAQGLVSKPIPSSGERIPVIGVGTARRYESAATEAERAPLREVVRNLPKLGGRLIDTAPSYGQAESVVGDLVAEVGNRDQLFIATKVGRGRQGVQAGKDEIEASFRKLKTDRIDMLQIHNLGGVPEMLPVLREMKQAKRIRYYGVTTSSDGQYAALEEFMKREPMDVVQVDYAIDNRGVEERILPLAAEKGIAVLTNLPFGRGRVFEKLGKQPLPDWAKAIGITTWAQFALKYVVSHPAVTVAIPGTAKLEYLTDNLGAARGPMPDDATRRRMAALVESA